MQRPIVITVSLIILGGCASAVQRIETADLLIDKSINCAEAEQHISQLQLHETSTSERVTNSLATLIPTSAVLNLLAGEYGSRAQLASGRLDSRLHAKIADITNTCGTQALASNNQQLSAMP